MNTTHTDIPITLEQAWENAARDTRSADAVFDSIVSKIKAQSNTSINDLAAHEAVRTLIGFYQTILYLGENHEE